jgi:GH15 family glucan-1,4-alpha-glucosidase
MADTWRRTIARKPQYILTAALPLHASVLGWLAQAQALAGQVDRAKKTFERAIAYANDLGLLAEEVDPETKELLGNFPQAFSHIGLVNAAWAISEARTGAPAR